MRGPVSNRAAPWRGMRRPTHMQNGYSPRQATALRPIHTHGHDTDWVPSVMEQVNVGEGSTMTVMGRTYQLLQFHFHRPSEERINGKTFDMVIHLVHQDEEGKLAVVAVMLDRGNENPLIQTLWNNMPLEVNQDVTPSVAIDLNSLLPENRAYYTYMGSLTTPPCTENVLWIVFKQPMPVSADQVAIFSRLYKNNARPIQPSNNRLVKENR